MLIKSIELINWRSHKHTLLQFSRGTNILIGIMGSGKSSVLEAICFALYGTIPAMHRRKIKIGDVISKNILGTKQHCRVNLVFEHDNAEYNISREIANGKSNAELRENGKLIEAKSDAVSSMISNLLGVNYDLFIKAIYAEQNKLDYFLTINPSERKRQIDALIGMDRFESARSNILKVANRMSREISILQDSLGKYDLIKLNEEKRRLEEEMQRNENETKNISDKLEALSKKIVLLDAELKELGEKKKIYDELSKKIAERETQIVEMSNNLKEYNERDMESKIRIASELRSKSDALSKDLKKQEERMADLNRLIGKLRSTIENANKKNKEKADLIGELKEIECDRTKEELIASQKECNENIAKLEKELGAASKEIQLLDEQCNHLNLEIQEIEKLVEKFPDIKQLSNRELEIKKGERDNCISWIASLKEVIKINADSISRLEKDDLGACPVCDTILDKKKVQEIIAKKRGMIENSKKELEGYHKRLIALNDEIAKYEEMLEKRDEVEKKILELPSKKSKRKEMEELKADIRKKIEQNMKLLEKRRNELKQVEALVHAAEKIESIKTRIKEIDEFIKLNENAEADLENFTKEQKSLADEVEKGRVKLVEIERQIVELDAGIKEIEQNVALRKRIESRKNELIELKRRISDVGYEEKQYEKTYDAATELKIEAEGLKAKKDGYAKNLALLKNNLDYVKKQIDEYSEIDKKIKYMSNCVKDMKEFQQALVETQAALRSELVNSINAVMKRIWRVVYPYEDISEVRMAATESDYLLQAKRGGEWISIEGNTSGGERASIVLCLRVALSIVLAPQMNLLVLDEPTHNLDENGIGALAQILRDKLPSIIGQTFVITHDDALKEGASGRLYIFNRAKEKHEPTLISETF